MKLNGKSVILSTLYRSRSQSTDEFDNFFFKVRGQFIFHNIKETFLTCILGDINAKSFVWCVNDKSSPEVSLLLLIMT